VLAREGVQLVVTDVGMPEMDGPELAARIRERWPGRHPILFLSGYASTQRQDGPLAAEEAFLAKPFTPYALLTAVRRAIERG
jgi:CheY-like chemotaxis protein